MCVCVLHTRCKVCKLVTAKDALRFGFTSNYRGHISNNYLHVKCVKDSGRRFPDAETLQTLDGFAQLDEVKRSEAYAAIGAPPPPPPPPLEDLEPRPESEVVSNLQVD